MHEAKPRVYEQGESNNRASHAKEEIPTYERPQSQVNILGLANLKRNIKLQESIKKD